jgi:hypothetical protein
MIIIMDCAQAYNYNSIVSAAGWLIERVFSPFFWKGLDLRWKVVRLNMGIVRLSMGIVILNMGSVRFKGVKNPFRISQEK